MSTESFQCSEKGTPYSLPSSTSLLLSKSFDRFVQPFCCGRSSWGPFPLRPQEPIPTAEMVSDEEILAMCVLDDRQMAFWFEPVGVDRLGWPPSDEEGSDGDVTSHAVPQGTLSTFVCQWEDCPESFATKSGLATHCTQHISPPAKKRKRSFVCAWFRGECGAEFHSEKNLAKHLASADHIGQRPYKSKEELLPNKTIFCSTCGKGFSDGCSLKKHQKTHDKNRERFYCGEEGCKKSYSTKTDRDIHQKTHRNELPYRCTYRDCCRSFPRSSELYAHERSHDNMMPHKCSVCDKGFREKSRLEKHEKTHWKARRV